MKRLTALRGDAGQTSFEYLGIAVVIAVIIGVLMRHDEHRDNSSERHPRKDPGHHRRRWLSGGRLQSDKGQTLGLYIVAVAALFFLAFAFFAVGQASSVRNSAQTAADAAALAAARETRDGIRDEFLDALKAGDLDKLTDLLMRQRHARRGCVRCSEYLRCREPRSH